MSTLKNNIYVVVFGTEVSIIDTTDYERKSLFGTLSGESVPMCSVVSGALAKCAKDGVIQEMYTIESDSSIEILTDYYTLYPNEFILQVKENGEQIFSR